MNYNEPTKVEVQPTIPVKNTESTQPPVNNTSFWSWLKLPSFFTPAPAPAPAPLPKTGGKRKSRLTKKNKKSKSVKSRK
jgi:hypothetical protein